MKCLGIFFDEIAAETPKENLKIMKIFKKKNCGRIHGRILEGTSEKVSARIAIKISGGIFEKKKIQRNI